MAALEGLIGQYGPFAIFVGTFFEGETIVIVSGFLSHQNIINPAAVALSAFLGSFLGDQLWFYLGRRHAAHPIVVRITGRPLFEKVVSAIEAHPKKFILSFRFIYGVRTISPVAIGFSDVPAKVFASLNALAAAIWAITFTSLGYFFSAAVETIIGDIKRFEHIVLVAIGIAFTVFVIYQIVLGVRRRFTAESRLTENQNKESPEPPSRKY